MKNRKRIYILLFITFSMISVISASLLIFISHNKNSDKYNYILQKSLESINEYEYVKVDVFSSTLIDEVTLDESYVYSINKDSTLFTGAYFDNTGLNKEVHYEYNKLNNYYDFFIYSKDLKRWTEQAHVDSLPNHLYPWSIFEDFDGLDYDVSDEDICYVISYEIDDNIVNRNYQLYISKDSYKIVYLVENINVHDGTNMEFNNSIIYYDIEFLKDNLYIIDKPEDYILYNEVQIND